ncbi:MICOS complex subunit MIC25 isoform X5 [Mustela nigripes]|uniref:MICOS complex subunit MIC25 isoform X5 n=1 Tax=Mustela putorius furo TaxID=9669 RepID=A0A8U0TDI5_MUSPF|nr:MICOS complex subunit MIC25 isoform X5 [Mustela putorius furo]XP_059243918.1 MICOS complex subunit MIC25 isoform X5 [Mustela nigripes]
MGSTESSEARRVSFGMDEEERVRVLQGIRLSENVVHRMKDSSQSRQAGQPASPPAPQPSTVGTCKGPEKDSKLPRSEYGGGRQSSGVEEDFLKRYKQEQAKVQEELFQVVTREREAATKHRSVSVKRGEGSVDQEKQKSTQLNVEMYKLSSQQFHEAASKMEGTIKPRRIEPVCSGLQAQILRCYRDHLQEVLLCSDLVKAYQHCVSAAHKG